MGIVGMGGIGSALARRAHYGFDMRIVATDARPVPQPPGSPQSPDARRQPCRRLPELGRPEALGSAHRGIGAVEFAA